MRSLFALSRTARTAVAFAAVLLAIEFLDEIVFGAREAAWPRIRTDIGLSYAEIGLLLGIPNVVSALTEPAFGILGDTRHRVLVMVAGGATYAAALALFAISNSFFVAILAFALLYPASGAFVGLAQATLMDTSGKHHERAMAEWTFAGSLGVVAGPLALAGLFFFGFGWRLLFLGFAGGAVVLTLMLAWARAARVNQEERNATTARDSFRNAVSALRRRDVWRWLVLLAFSDFMTDTLLGFLALFLVDVRGFSEATASLGVAVWAIVGLAGDGAIILILRRVAGLTWVRWASLAMAAVYIPLMFAGSPAATFVLLAALGFLNSGGYAVLKAQLYAAMPGRSGAVFAIASAFGIVTAFVPTLLGFIADSYGVSATMWLLLAGPLLVAVGIPWRGVDVPLALAEAEA